MASDGWRPESCWTGRTAASPRSCCHSGCSRCLCACGTQRHWALRQRGELALGMFQALACVVAVPESGITPMSCSRYLAAATQSIRLTVPACVDDRKQDGSMIWRQSEEYSRHREYPWTLGAMQIYASYNYRRDFIDAVKAPGALIHTRALTVCPVPPTPHVPLLQPRSAHNGMCTRTPGVKTWRSSVVSEGENILLPELIDARA